MNLFDPRVRTPHDILGEAVERYQPRAVFALLSGGNDSLHNAHVVSQHPRFTACVHINTGIGIEETREYVRDLCRAQNWPLMEMHPPALSYEQMVLTYGFPGPGAHQYAYSWLKERAIRKLVGVSKQKHTDRIMLCTGVRQQESARRMGHAREVTKINAQIWVAPLLYVSACERSAYIAREGLPTNPVADVLHKSGECFCGAFAGSKHGTPEQELEEAEYWFPSIGKRIRALQARARQAGVWAEWGKTPPVPCPYKAAQVQGQTFMPLCQNCLVQSAGQEIVTRRVSP